MVNLSWLKSKKATFSTTSIIMANDVVVNRSLVWLSVAVIVAGLRWWQGMIDTPTLEQIISGQVLPSNTLPRQY